MKKGKNGFEHFDVLQLTLASPDQIMEWSYGEVTKAETINYRTFRSEPDGLFCEKIFGPTKNYECYCGKYKKIRYKGIVCDKCGVEVTTKDSRRERMGHINLAVPVTHVWFAYGIPHKMSIILEIPHKKLLSVIYYTRYMVVEIEKKKRKEMVKKAEELKEEELTELEKQLKEELKHTEEEFSEQLKDLKKSKKKQNEFKVTQIEHKEKQALARVRKEFAEKEEQIVNFYQKIDQILTKLEVGTVLSEDEYIDLSERDLLFFEAMMGAQAIQKLLEKLDLDKEIRKLRETRELKQLEGYNT